MEFVFDEIPIQFYVFLTFWLSAWIASRIYAPTDEGHFSNNGLLLSFNHVTGMTIAIISLYFNDEKIFMEANCVLWFTSFFIVDFLDCLHRKDVVYTFHAIFSLILCRLICKPRFYNLRLASLGSFVELSSLFLWRWKKTKKKSDFQLFAFVFFVCRFVWPPIVILRTSRIVDLGSTEYIMIGAYFLMQSGFFYKIVNVLLNYEEGKSKES